MPPHADPYPTILTVYPQPADGVRLGGSQIVGVPFALIIAGEAGDRYFHPYLGSSGLVWDVFLWRDDLHFAEYEVRASRPAIHGSWEAPGGSVISSSLTDGFEMSLASSEGGAVIRVDTGSFQVHMDGSGLQMANVNVSDSMVQGSFAAFRLGADGGFSMGVSWNYCPSGMRLGPLSPAVELPPT